MLMVAPGERRVVYVEVGRHSLLSTIFDFLFQNKLVNEEDISVMSVELSMLDKLELSD